MLLLSTILDIEETMTEEVFIRLVLEWNNNSPHKDNIVPDIKWNGEKNIRYGNDNCSITIMEYNTEKIIAIRYERIDFLIE